MAAIRWTKSFSEIEVVVRSREKLLTFEPGHLETCEIFFLKNNFTTIWIPILTLFLSDYLYLPQKVKMADIKITKLLVFLFHTNNP